MSFLLPPTSPLPSLVEGGRTNCSLLAGSFSRRLDPREHREHLDYHARTCDDRPGKMFAACPVCRHLRRRYIDIRIAEGSVRWLFATVGAQELGAHGEPQAEVRKRLLSRTAGAAAAAAADETAIVLLDAPDGHVWAQIRHGANAPGARQAADAAERETTGEAVRWTADRESAWLLERYSE